MTTESPEAVTPQQGHWIVFVAGSWLWSVPAKDPGYRSGYVLGDMAGPFETWTDACEYLLDRWPLVMPATDDPPLTEEQVKSYQESFEDLIRWVDAPENWVRAPVTSDTEAAEALEAVEDAQEDKALDQSLLRIEIEEFWKTHQVT
jgi:hypothetical protein